MKPAAFAFCPLLLYACQAAAQIDTTALQEPDTTTAVAMPVPAPPRYGDTLLTGIQDYRNGTGPFYFLPFAGTNGSAIQDLSQPDSAQTLRPGHNPFGWYETRPDRSDDTSAAIRFSRLSYILGSKKEQDFTVDHRQPLSRNSAFGVLFRSANALGHYANQSTSLRNFNLNGRWANDANTWTAQAGYLSNRLSAGENGGLKDDESFESTGGDRSLDVQLDDAASRRSNRLFYLDQRVTLAGGARTDSTETQGPRLELIQHAAYEIRWSRFTAGRFYDEFFDHVFYDSTATNDSIRIRSMRGSLGLAASGLPWLDRLAGARTQVYVLATGERLNYRQQGTDTTLDDVGAEAGLAMAFAGRTSAALTLRQAALNRSGGVYFMGIVLRSSLAGLACYLGASTESRRPDLVYSFFDSNHFYWNIDQPNERMMSVHGGASAAWKKHRLQLDAGFRSINRLAYFDESAMPARAGSTVTVTTVRVRHEFSFGIFRTVNTLDLKKTGAGSPVRVPTLAWYGSVFVERTLFRCALEVQAGTAVRYAERYAADAYMPATGQFYLQDEKKIGGYPFVDLFADFRIKATRFFFKLDHFNAGWSGNRYYLIPHYPYPGRTIRFGIIWDFRD